MPPTSWVFSACSSAFAVSSSVTRWRSESSVSADRSAVPVPASCLASSLGLPAKSSALSGATSFSSGFSSGIASFAAPEPASLETGGLLVFSWRDGGPPAPRPLRELDSRQVGRHTYTILLEILDADEEAYHARYLHRITQGGKVISEEELTGYAYRPPWDVLERELVTAGFVQAEGAEGAEGLLAWRLA
jgi:hypothetical protein